MSGLDHVNDSAISAELMRAYLDTQYCVYASWPNPLSEAFELRVGAMSPALKRIYSLLNRNCAAFLTACNPRSQRVSDVDNRLRQKQLELTLGQYDVLPCHGEGRDPAGIWPAESSVLAIGLALDDARRIGTLMEQNAIVWCGPDAVAQLIALR